MTNETHPCADGLGEACFAEYPKWAKKAFAYRLMHAICPANITRRLPKGLPRALIGPGATYPSGWILPPGMIIPPGFTVPANWKWFLYFILGEGQTWDEAFPEGWTVGDPLPDGVTINTAMIFPEGWKVGDKLPEGIIVKEGAIFPKGWTAGDGLPDGVTVNLTKILPAGWTPTGSKPSAGLLPPVEPEEVEKTGADAPLYPSIWGGGPIHRPMGGIVAVPPWFYEPFNNLTDNVWSDISANGGTAQIMAGRLKLTGTEISDQAGVQRTEARAWPADFSFAFWMVFISESHYFNVEIWTGTYVAAVQWISPSTVRIRDADYNWATYDAGNYSGDAHTWKFEIKDQMATLYLDSNLVFENVLIFASAANPGVITMYTTHIATAYIDNITIRQL